jgi:hypothetical protein
MKDCTGVNFEDLGGGFAADMIKLSRLLKNAEIY